jgi:protein-L-isoaspartate(D-aspartate) O-methyltransferase
VGENASSSACPWLELLEAVEQTIGHQLAPAVRDAFVRVDRRAFVPRYYVQQGRAFVEQEAGAEIYQNRAFLTRLDARGVPNSSSSQPSLMAPMLEALDVQRGSRVLEIGTGTGYNAALLAELVGAHGQVVSVDIAADLVEQACARLYAWPWVKSVVADGLAGYPKDAPYDRIIATGGAPTIPQAWGAQLVEGGILVGSLTLPLSTATPLYRLQKDAHGTLHGAFLATPAFFMPLYQHASRHTLPDFTFYDALPVCEQAWTTLDVPRLIKHPGLALWVSQQMAGLCMTLRPAGTGSPGLSTCLLLPDRALLMVRPCDDQPQRFEIEVRGREPVWSRWLAAYTEWDARGRPAPEQYRLSLDRAARLTIALQET